MSPLAAHVAPRSLKRATEKFYKVPTTALQSLYYGYEKVRIKQLLPQTHAVKFVYEVNFNKKQTVSVVYKQTQAVKTRECFVNTSPWARWSPGGKLPAVCSWLSHARRMWPAPAARWNQSQWFCPRMAQWQNLNSFVKIYLPTGLLFHCMDRSPCNTHTKNGHNDY